MANGLQRWILGGFAVVVVAGLTEWRSLGPAARAVGSRGAATRPNPQLAGLMPYATPLSDSQLAMGRERELRIGDEIRRDPFAPAVTHVAELPRTTAVRAPAARAASTAEWHVSATLLAGDKRAAVINDELVYVGDHVPGGTLMQVERDHILVMDTKGATHVVAVEEGDT